MARSTAARIVNRRRAADSIVEDLRAQIASGALPHGCRLPPERSLAEQYGVSGPTVREALQGLSAMGLLDVRHGSGTYVSALADTVIAKSLGTVIQLQGVSVQNILGLLGALNGYAARLAVTRAVKKDVVRLEAAVAAISAARDIDDIHDSIKEFVGALAAAAHDPLLLSIVQFLLDVQLALARELWSPTYESWRELVEQLQPDRSAIVAALKRRDGDELAARVTALHARAVRLIDRKGVFSRVPASDKRLARILETLSSRRRA